MDTDQEVSTGNGATQQQGVVEIPSLNIRLLEVRLTGDSPLICHRFSEKAQQMMLDKQMKKAKRPKEAKDPELCFKESLYPFPGKPGKYGFPAVAFKAAAVTACSHVDGLKKTVMRGAFHVMGDLVEIEGQPTPRQDTVRIHMGVADIRIRGQFTTWATKLTVRYNASVVTAPQLIHLFNVSGFAVGVGEWRPERDGSYGMFSISGADS